MNFISYKNEIKQMINRIVKSEMSHAKWLNTLSFLENCGARKIAACEHPTLVRAEMLKHAAEEFRHAHYLKSQLSRITTISLDDYSIYNLLGGSASLHYLTTLDCQTVRYLHERKHPKRRVKEIAYLLVTYAIELRAEEIYPIYNDILRQMRSKVTVKSILWEEKEHLNEMRKGLSEFPSGCEDAKHVCAIEATICKNWLESILEGVSKFALEAK